MASTSQETDVRIDTDCHECNDHWKEHLYQALKDGKWEIIERIIHKHPDEAFKAKLNKNGDKLLLWALNEGKGWLIIRLVGKITSEYLAESLSETDDFGNTALHLAANVGRVKYAKKIVEAKKELLKYPNRDGFLPIQLAVRQEPANAYKMTYYLLKVSKEDETYSELRNNFSRVMHSLVTAGFYDLALDLLKYKEARKGDPIRDLELDILEKMASDPSGFKSSCRLNFWKSLIYSYSSIPSKHISRTKHSTYAVYKAKFWNALAQVPMLNIENIPALKWKHQCAPQLFESLCKIADENGHPLEKTFLLGAQNGIEEIVRTILDSYLTAIKNEGKHRTAFHVAVMYRHVNIFKMLYKKNIWNGQYLRMLDKKGKSVLDFVKEKGHQAGIESDSGVVFKMQRELQWFMKVTELVKFEKSPEKENQDLGLPEIPLVSFEKCHAKMAANDKEWMTGMATASSVAASLIATVAFSAAFQVPGGNHTSGIPNFSNDRFFKVFAISDALALFFSITSVLSFLSIYTSRYKVRDYLLALPIRVIVGLISLFFSLICLMMAFSSTLFLVFAKKNVLLLTPIIALSCIPVILYVILQLPSLITMIKSTFYSGITLF
ncbi:ankyrin repeat-containing ITN1-like [Olea europaea subsp. europaea]|uniref:Ankyrin repeat-containing ITN1-like n=1 Tax=Olea europaea subsp. europaea TaxID=158383 RepID=A0A8S0RTN4_OLEEU|nr:ankyrin repeat-containing ITN1-like [Olea europaea subsp. europaea]